jgi:hypothetical protein
VVYVMEPVPVNEKKAERRSSKCLLCVPGVRNADAIAIRASGKCPLQPLQVKFEKKKNKINCKPIHSRVLRY